MKDVSAEIRRIKEAYGDRLVILAHYYQKDEVFALADVTGDSYALAVAASQSRAESIVFCGVRFMAESARILARPEQRVYLPDREAGCPLADMADEGGLITTLELTASAAGRKITPVVYINSTAAVKAAAAEAGGIVCTSSNAEAIVRSVHEEGKAVLFLPDRNLGLYVARRLSLSGDEIAFCGKKTDLVHASPDVRLFIWDGFCNVHVRFTAMDVIKAKTRFPYARILVHPECREEVTAAADYVGSTSGIIRECERARPGEVLFIGTELNLVNRLAVARRDATILPLRESGCVNMNKITIEKLLRTLEGIGAPASPYEVLVPDEERMPALHSLRAMIERVEQGKKAQ